MFISKKTLNKILERYADRLDILIKQIKELNERNEVLVDIALKNRVELLMKQYNVNIYSKAIIDGFCGYNIYVDEHKIKFLRCASKFDVLKYINDEFEKELKIYIFDKDWGNINE